MTCTRFDWTIGFFLGVALPFVTSSALAVPPLTAQIIPGSAAPPPAGETAYTLGAGDQVRIDIFQVPQYSGEAAVLVDGTLNLPLVGNVSVEGLTIAQATQALSAAYGQFLRRPILTVSLLSRREVKIGIAGEVNQPGSYSLPPDEAEYPTLTRLLETAGGLTQLADVRQVQVYRPQASGGNQVLNVDLWEFLQTGDLRYDVTLRDGDTVFIPTATNVNLAEAPLITAATFGGGDTDRPINIAVTGEVFRPGTYTIVGGAARTTNAGEPGGESGTGGLPTVTRAIQVAGGIKPLADVRRVEVRRATRSGTQQSFQVDLWKLLDGDLQQDAILQEGDTIVIPQVPELDPSEAAEIAAASFSPDTIKVNIVGEVTRSGVVDLAPNSTLNQGILAAGGFNTRARRGSVQLLRLNVDGSVSRETIEVDFEQGINAENNPALQNNDVIVVGRSDLATTSDTLNSILDPLRGVFSIFEIPFQFLRLFD